MKRKFTSLLLTVCLLAGMVFAAPRALAISLADAAVKIECAAGYFYYNPATEAVVKGVGTGNNVSGTLDLTAVEGITIREIGDFAFQNNRELVSVKLPATVAAVGDYAFGGCNKLKEIEMPGVTALGSGAFDACTSLETALSKDVQSIGDGAFSGTGKIFIDSESVKYASDENGALYALELGEKATLLHCPNTVESFTVPDTVKTIGFGAFFNSSKLKTVTIPASVTTLDHSAFGYCPYLERLAIPASVTEIRGRGIVACSGGVTVAPANSKYYSDAEGNLYQKNDEGEPEALLFCPTDQTALDLPATVTVVDDNAFVNCYQLASIRFDGAESGGNGSVLVQDGVLYDRSSGQVLRTAVTAAEVVIPEGITKLPNGAFAGCSSLTSIQLAESVTEISQMAFDGCLALESILVPAGTTVIEPGAFIGVKEGCRVTVASGNANYQTLEGSGAVTTKDGTRLLYLPLNSATVTVPEGVESIAPNVFTSFYYQTMMNQVVLPDSVTVLEQNSFQDSRVQSVTLSPNLTSIGTSAFWRCESLRNIEIPASVTEIGAGAFSDCVSLESVSAGRPQVKALKSVLRSTVGTGIGSGAFSNCSSLKRITVPYGITAILEDAFAGCTGLEQVELTDGVSSIGDRAFDGCQSLRSVYLTPSVLAIGADAFRGCSSGLTFYGELSPAVESYATAQGIPFVAGPIPGPAPGGSGGASPEPGEEIPFTDIAGHWAEDSLVWVYHQGLFRGVSDHEFQPEGKMERGMLATVLYRLAKEPEAAGELRFSDVSENAYYGKAVLWGAENGIILGDGEGRYRPRDKVTREQLAVMLYRYAGLTGVPEGAGDLSAFTDADQISGYAAEAMRWAVAQGILNGKGGGKLDPRGNASRAEVAAMIQRFAE